MLFLREFLRRLLGLRGGLALRVGGGTHDDGVAESFHLLFLSFVLSEQHIADFGHQKQSGAFGADALAIGQTERGFGALHGGINLRLQILDQSPVGLRAGLNRLERGDVLGVDRAAAVVYGRAGPDGRCGGRAGTEHHRGGVS